LIEKKLFLIKIIVKKPIIDRFKKKCKFNFQLFHIYKPLLFAISSPRQINDLSWYPLAPLALLEICFIMIAACHGSFFSAKLAQITDLNLYLIAFLKFILIGIILNISFIKLL
jgi:hypothetical protein